jgi:hypothetical protein
MWGGSNERWLPADGASSIAPRNKPRDMFVRDFPRHVLPQQNCHSAYLVGRRAQKIRVMLFWFWQWPLQDNFLATYRAQR